MNILSLIIVFFQISIGILKKIVQKVGRAVRCEKIELECNVLLANKTDIKIYDQDPINIICNYGNLTKEKAKKNVLQK